MVVTSVLLGVLAAVLAAAVAYEVARHRFAGADTQAIDESVHAALDFALA